MPFAHTWNITTPPDTQPANLLGQDCRDIKQDTMQRIAAISGTLANRPTPETTAATVDWTGVLYFATDTSQIFQWSGTAWVDVTTSIVPPVPPIVTGVKVYPTNLTPVTVANTVVATSLQVISLAANDVGVGQTFYIEAQGIIGIQAGPPTIVVDLMLDGISLASVLSITVLAAANSQPWALRAFFTGVTTGVGGVVTSAVMLWMSTNSGGAFVSNMIGAGNPPQTVVVDTTIPHNLGLRATWSAADPVNTITENTLSVYRVG